MEFVAIREALTASLEHAVRCADAKAAMPSLVNVVLRATADGVVHVFATDLIRAFQGSFHAEVKRAGVVAVHAKGFSQLVGGFPAKSEITVAVEKNLTTKLSAKKTRASLAGIEADIMPGEPVVDRKGGVRMPSAALLAALDAVRPFMSPDDTRPHLAAICFTGTHLVTTNGHALGVTPSPAPTPKVLVPRAAIETWCAALRDVDGDVTLFATTPTAPAALETPAGIFSTKLVDGAFPSWEQVVPTQLPWAIEVDAGEVREAVRGMPSDRASPVKISAQKDGMLDELVITGENTDTLRAKTASVSAKVLRGREAIPAAWGVVLNYLLSALSPVTGPVVIEGHGELDPFKISAPSGDYFAVLMPWRVS